MPYLSRSSYDAAITTALDIGSDEPFESKTCPYCTDVETSDATGLKQSPWDWWHQLFGKTSNVFAVAPMVDQSELPFRILCRRYGATLAYTPMYHARQFTQNSSYRKNALSEWDGLEGIDRPLLIQFCANDPATLLEATRFVQNRCDGIDLNLGCPQGIARRGHYGAFLMEDWELIHRLVHTLSTELSIPVTVKIRRFDSVSLTVRYAKMIEVAGASMIAVHGRTRTQKGPATGQSDLSYVRAVKEALHIPVCFNGNVANFAEAQSALTESKADGVLSAEGLLFDPRLFANPFAPLPGPRRHGVLEKPLVSKEAMRAAIEVSEEYLAIARDYPVARIAQMVKAHLFKMLYYVLTNDNEDLRPKLGQVRTGPSVEEALDALLDFVKSCKERLMEKRQRND